MKRWARRLFRLALCLLALGVLLSIGAFFVLRSQWLRERLRTKIVELAERATGGKVELGTFDFDPYGLTVTVRDFVLRGKEPEGEAPLAHVKEVHAGVRVVSLLGRKAYLDTLNVVEPRIRILIFPDGTTNIPGPKVSNPTGPTVFERFVSIAARRFSIRKGEFEYDNRKIPIDLQARNFEIDFQWESDGPRYRGVVKAQPFLFNWPIFDRMEFDAKVELTMDKTGLQFQKADVRKGGSQIIASGTMVDYRRPRIRVDVDGDIAMQDFARPLHLPIEAVGKTRYKGELTYADGDYLLTGTLAGSDLAVRQDRWSIENVSLNGKVRLVRDLVTVSDLSSEALDGRFRGSAEIRRWRDFHVKGSISGFSLEQVRQMGHTQYPFPWSGFVSGPVDLTGSILKAGVRNLVLVSALAIEARPTRIPLTGLLNFEYRQASQELAFTNSFLRTPRNQVDFTGRMGEAIRAHMQSTDLNEFLPAFEFLSDNPPQQLPVQLDGGTAVFDGTVTSPLKDAQVEGKVTVTRFMVDRYRFDRLTTNLRANARSLTATGARVEQNGSLAEGSATVGLTNWRMRNDGALQADVTVRQAVLEKVLPSEQVDAPIKGTLSGPFRIDGTVGAPAVRGQVAIEQAEIAGEPFRSIQFRMQLNPQSIEITSGLADHRTAAIPFRAVYRHEQGDWDNGHLDFEFTARNAALSMIESVAGRRQGIDSRIDIHAAAQFRIEERRPIIESISSSVAAREIQYHEQPVGFLTLEARTRNERVDVTAAGQLLGAPVKGTGEWQLDGDASGLGSIDAGPFQFEQIRDLLKAGGSTTDIPLEGSFHTEMVASGALRRPETLRARVNISQFEVRPRNEDKRLSDAIVAELTLQSTGPIIVEVDSEKFNIVQAAFTGQETNLQVSGTLSARKDVPWNVQIRGGLNLAVFQDFDPLLHTSGTAELNASIRGTLERPMLGGRMEIQNAALNHRDLPNGVENASGVIAFDRNRALLQNFTAQTGGGSLKLNGFVTIAGQDNRLSYRMNGQLERVRIRYPEGASTTVDASLSLTGTADQSLLAGTVTILRSGFTPRTDIGSLLLERSRPVQTPTSSSILRGMQFDIHMVSAPNLQLETSVTQGVQAAVDMRVRGSPSKPVLLGTVSVNQGELTFFGTTYTITRGTISFFNAARIEPVLDVDFETTVRAVTVNMNISGPIDKPNVTYRSDPPLQTSDIVALLAVGRTPTDTTVTSQSNLAGRGTGLYAGTETILGQALSAGVSGRLQRFFGVSRVKIDPQLIGLETTPQARLTIEQQISRDITLTYVTNLTGTLQQLVRLQWDLRREWSLIGVRDENGVVGADILFRKRFK